MSAQAPPWAGASNRRERRALGHRGKSGIPQESSTPSTQVMHGVCRSCGKRREIILPGRICTKCIEAALEIAQRASDAALLAALEQELAEDDLAMTGANDGTD